MKNVFVYMFHSSLKWFQLGTKTVCLKFQMVIPFFNDLMMPQEAKVPEEEKNIFWSDFCTVNCELHINGNTAFHEYCLF